MHRNLAIACLLFAACASPTLARVEVPPASPVTRELPPNPPAATDEAATQKWLSEEIARQRAAESAPAHTPTAPVAEPAPLTPTNEEATRDWLDRTIQERRAASPDTPPEPIYQTVERTVYVDRPVYYGSRYDRVYGYGYDDCGEPRYYYEPRHRHSTFPINTAIGAGIGAIIGHQSHHRDRGAAIGAGIGLLFDLAR